jgi:ureidoacrylate peracid hydrolase
MTMVREMLTTLEQKIDPQWTALLVIDMQNDFCAEGGAFHRSGVNVLPLQAPAKPIIRLVEDAHQVNVPVIFIRNVYNTPEGWYLSDVILEQARRGGHGRYYTIPMCERDSWGGEFFEGIRAGKSDLVIVKHRFNAFFNTDLDLVLRNKGIRTVIACGVLTNVCVESTVRDAYIRDYYVVVPSDCVGARDEEFQRASLRTIATSFGQIVVSEDVRQVWKSRRLDD